MDEGCSCPICFGEYASSGDHRIVSMKCGHLFGQSCLLGWFGSKKRAICPTCTVPSTKSQIRTIFASKISALGSENEQKLLDKFLIEYNEKNALLLENKKLKAQIDCLKIELANFNKEESSSVEFKIHLNLFKKLNSHNPARPINSFVVFDDVRNVIVCTGFKHDCPVLYRYSSSTFDFISVLTFTKERHISNLILSPFKDGLVLISIDSSVFLINIYSFCIVYVHDVESKITALSFHKNNRSVFYAADENVYVYIVDLDSKSAVKKMITNVSIHSICVVENILYVASVFKIYEIDLENMEVADSDVKIPRVCTNMYARDDLLLFTFRNEDNTVSYYIKGKSFSHYNPQYKQIRRHRDKIMNNLLYLIDDENNTLAIHDVRSLELLHKYEFKEVITDFCVENSHTVVLTKLHAYIYK